MQALSELPFVGGNPALDFVNTAEQRGHPLAGEALHTPADLRVWGWRYGILAETAKSKNPAGELSKALEARELLYRLWDSRVRRSSDDRADLRRLAELATEAWAAGALQPAENHRLCWRWDSSQLTTVRHVAVTAAVELLTAPASSRLKQCPGEHCGWFFLDTTKRGNRRWCLMSECGQAAKSARRRRRPAPESMPSA